MASKHVVVPGGHDAVTICSVDTSELACARAACKDLFTASVKDLPSEQSTA